MLHSTMSMFRIVKQVSAVATSDDSATAIHSIPGDLCVDKVHSAWIEAEPTGSGEMTMQRFCRSRLRFLITVLSSWSFRCRTISGRSTRTAMTRSHDTSLSTL